MSLTGHSGNGEIVVFVVSSAHHDPRPGGPGQTNLAKGPLPDRQGPVREREMAVPV